MVIVGIGLNTCVYSFACFHDWANRYFTDALSGETERVAMLNFVILNLQLNFVLLSPSPVSSPMSCPPPSLTTLVLPASENQKAPFRRLTVVHTFPPGFGFSLLAWVSFAWVISHPHIHYLTLSCNLPPWRGVINDTWGFPAPTSIGEWVGPMSTFVSGLGVLASTAVCWWIS
jgi:hypothetical protein